MGVTLASVGSFAEAQPCRRCDRREKMAPVAIDVRDWLRFDCPRCWAVGAVQNFSHFGLG
jgi:hypothetical protein